jgi:hypothetical protein
VSVELSDEAKETLTNVLQHAASQDKAVIEFTKTDGELYAKEITEHVAVLEEMND